MSTRTNAGGLAVAIAIVALALVVPAAAGASNASVSGVNLFFFATAGETNNLTVAFDGTDYVLTDPGAAITPGAGCAAVNANQVKCAGATVKKVDLRLGDLNDSAEVTESVVGLGDDSDPGATIQGGVGNDTLVGGTNISNSLYGHSTSFDEPGEDTLIGGSMDDALRGGGGNDELQGLGGNDRTLRGGEGVDRVDGGPGNDTVEEGSTPSGADSLIGGPGLDTVSYDQRKGEVGVSLNGLADDGEAAEGDNVNGEFTRIETGSGNDTVTGSDRNESFSTGAGDDVISAGGGGDRISARDGNDVLNGADGADLLVGGAGDDEVNGGPGDDLFSDSDDSSGSGSDLYLGGQGTDRLSYSTDEPLTISLDGVANDGRPGEADNAGANLEDFNGGPRADILTGNGSANQIDGGPGNDRISGRGGPDGLFGGPGDDELDGGNGIDGIEGQGGSDSIRSRDSSADEIGCGSASDVLLADSLDIFSVTCDSSSTGARITSPDARLNSKAVAKVKVKCPSAEGIACKVKIIAKKGKKTLAKGSGKVKSGKSKNVTIKLTKAGRQQSSNKLKTKAKTTLTDATGAKVSTSRKLVLKR